ELALLLVLDVEAVAPLLKLAGGLDGLEGLATGLSVHEELEFGDSRLAVRRVADDALPDRQRAAPAPMVVTGNQNGLTVLECALQGHVAVVVDLVVSSKRAEHNALVSVLDLNAALKILDLQRSTSQGSRSSEKGSRCHLELVPGHCC